MLVRAKQYEKALAYFYKAEIANPNTEMKKEIGTYVVECLENMGKSLDAEYQLESRASLRGEKKKKKAAQEVVARIGTREVVMGEINQAIETGAEYLITACPKCLAHLNCYLNENRELKEKIKVIDLMRFLGKLLFLI